MPAKPPPAISTVSMAHMLEHSKKDFHVRGVDYVCLRRTPDETLKLYFFEGDVTRLAQVANPHDHRYEFYTWVLAGRSQNVLYAVPVLGLPTIEFNRFEWFTPLLGGEGFHYVGRDKLREASRVSYGKGSGYPMRLGQIHTIKMLENETILMILQKRSEYSLGTPTNTWVNGEQPSIEGLYRPFTADEIMTRIKWVEERCGITIKVDD